MKPILGLTTTDPTSAAAGDPYDDDPHTRYEADDDVQNYRQLVPANIIVVAQDRTPVTLARIGDVNSRSLQKTKVVCPRCGRTRTNFKIDPGEGKCYAKGCGYAGTLTTAVVDVTRYSADFDRVLDITGIPFEDIWAARANDATTSIRLLDDSKLLAVLWAHGFDPTFGFDGVAPDPATKQRIRGGSREVLTRQRLNQGPWREALELRQAGVCAVTGGARPRCTREGAHLLRWAGAEEQNPQHGMLLRRDLHGLEEQGLLALRKLRGRGSWVGRC